VDEADQKRQPNLNDYLAGGLLSNGLVWMWIIALGYLANLSPTLSPAILADLSYVMYLVAGGLASYLVCKRAYSRHIVVAFRLVAIEWVFTVMLMLSMAAEPSIGMAVALLICFTMSGIAGAYLALRSQLRRRQA